ncbi:MAG: sugar phosphate isomerase/epimerase [Ruminococcaceae bacterium]|nr:sugar phosphate isomerase/epimerase [Oscillospiraceae bacterium]
MKLAIFYHHICKAAEETGRSIPEILHEMKEEGIEGIEFNVLDAREPVLSFLKNEGLAVSSIYAYVPVFNGDTEEGFTLVDRACAVGCKTVMVVPGSIPENMEKKDALKQSKEPLRRIAEYGAQRGITVTVEDYDGKRPLFSTSEDMLFFGNEIPELFYTYDSGNFHTVEDPLSAFEALKQKIRHVHLKDISHTAIAGCADARQLRSGDMVYDVPFGYGELPCAEILKRLREIGYKGYICLEHNAIAMMNANLLAVRWTKKH